MEPPEVVDDGKIVLNVGGSRHETRARTLLGGGAGTRLARLAERRHDDPAYDPSTGEYFFDRHPRAFDSVIHFMRTRELHVDQNVCGNVLKGELQYWGVEEHEIEACCWAVYSKYTEHKDTLEELDHNFTYVSIDLWPGDPRSARNRVWTFLEEPGSSPAAKVFAVLSMFMVTISIGTFVLETHPLFQVDGISGRPMSEVTPPDDSATGGGRQCCCDPLLTAAALTNTTTDPQSHVAMQIVDYISVSFFALEIIVRFAFAPLKCKFWRQPLNVIDVVCLVPHLLSVILGALPSLNAGSEISRILKGVLMMRVIRILRIFKLMKHYNAFKILVYTIKVSAKELLLMIIFLMTGVLMFSSLIYFAEQSNFPNIPMGIWWALVTMTTVGYGDKYPTSYLGYVIGSVCVLCGVLVIAFTVPIVVNNFSLYYSHAQTRIKVPNNASKKRKEVQSNNNEKGVAAAVQQLYFSETNLQQCHHQNHHDKQASVAATPRSCRVSTAVPSDVGIGFDNTTQEKQQEYEAETARIMQTLVASALHDDRERRRQEDVIREKRRRRGQQRGGGGDA